MGKYIHLRTSPPKKAININFLLIYKTNHSLKTSWKKLAAPFQTNKSQEKYLKDITLTKWKQKSPRESNWQLIHIKQRLFSQIYLQIKKYFTDIFSSVFDFFFNKILPSMRLLKKCFFSLFFYILSLFLITICIFLYKYFQQILFIIFSQEINSRYPFQIISFFLFPVPRAKNTSFIYKHPLPV